MTETFRTAIRWLRSDNRKAAPRTAIGNLKSVGFVTLAFTFALCGAVGAQPTRVPRIGYLGGTNAAAYAGRIEAFRQGLRELGYVEGKNIVIERRFAEGKPDRLSELAAELVRLKVDIIVSAGPTVTRLLKEATSTIPIVMTNEGDPVGSGFVASLARPGGNVTGLSSLAPELSGKRLELLKEIVPKLSRVAVLGNSTEPANTQSLREVELAAGAFGVKLQYLDILSPQDIEIAFRAASKERADAVLSFTGGRHSHCSPNRDCRTRGKEPAPSDIQQRGICRSGWAYELRDEPYRLVGACGSLCGQNSERQNTRRLTSGAADQVRVRDQSQSGEADRPDDSAERAGESGSGN